MLLYQHIANEQLSRPEELNSTTIVMPEVEDLGVFLSTVLRMEAEYEGAHARDTDYAELFDDKSFQDQRGRRHSPLNLHVSAEET